MEEGNEETCKYCQHRLAVVRGEVEYVTFPLTLVVAAFHLDTTRHGTGPGTKKVIKRHKDGRALFFCI